MSKTIGILLDDETFRGIPRRRTGYERIDLYNKAARQLKLTPFYMTLQTTGPGDAQGYMYDSGKYLKVNRPIPRVIHNRALSIRGAGIRKLGRLAASRIVYNRKNRFSKYRIYRLLAQNSSLRSYLPATVNYSGSRLVQAMKRFSALFIKPASGSVGIGIIKLAQTSGGKWTVYPEHGKPMQKSARQAGAFVKRCVGRQPYVIQEAIPLAVYRGRPYDLRVSVQRGGSGQWQVTGIVGKVAARGRHVTNVAKGGRVRRCETLFKASGLPAEQTRKNVRRASLEIAGYLGRRLPHLADIGLDMGVTGNGAVKFIEMNGRDQRITFKKAGLGGTFYRTYLTPLQYGKSLMKR